ncbi:MAG: T9SS type A sorting domain-containing protein, partial [Flavobacteriales bacterium]
SSSTSFCSGESLSLSVSSAYESYQWYLDGSPLSGATSSSYTALSGGSYSVVVTNAVGCEVTSEVLSVNQIVVSAPSNVEFENVTTTSAIVDWDNASPSGMYIFSYSADGGQTWVTNENLQGSQASLSGLLSGVTYLVEITSVSYACQSETFESSFTTTSVCLTPSSISETYSTNQVTIDWDMVEGADSYEVLYNFGEGYLSHTTSSNTVTLDLSNASVYVYYVRTNCSDEQVSEWSDIQSFTISCDEPTNISISNVGQEVTIDWDGSASLYRVIYNYGSGWVSDYPTESQYIIPNVPVGSIVYTYVRAICDESTNFFSPWAFASGTTVSGSRLSQSTAPEINLYPNPTKGIVNIELSNFGKEVINIKVVDAYGKQVFTQQINSSEDFRQTSFDLTKYSTGVYFIEIITETQRFTNRLILQ